MKRKNDGRNGMYDGIPGDKSYYSEGGGQTPHITSETGEMFEVYSDGIHGRGYFGSDHIWHSI